MTKSHETLLQNIFTTEILNLGCAVSMDEQNRSELMILNGTQKYAKDSTT